MRSSAIIPRLVLLLAAVLATGRPARADAPVPPSRAPGASLGVPVTFVENRGQLDRRARYVARGSDRTVFFTDHGIRIRLRDPAEPGVHWTVEIAPVGAGRVRPRGAGERAGEYHWFRRDRPVTGARGYARVRYEALWPGIDLRYRGDGPAMKYELHVAAGADPSRIAFEARAVSAVRLRGDGALLLETPAGSVVDEPPIAWQESEGRRVPVAVRFRVDGRRFEFDLGPYDRTRPLTIDPATLLHCGFLGGRLDDAIHDVAVQDDGHAYVTGRTRSDAMTFPVRLGPDLSHNGNLDAFVAKVRSDGSELVYCGYVGGSMEDVGNGIAVDGRGRATIVGLTWSSEQTFPVRIGPDLTFNGGTRDAFVARVSTDGRRLEYCGYVGGDRIDLADAVALDVEGRAVLVGQTSSTEASFPVAVGPDLTHNGSTDAFLGRVAPDGSALEFCGYLGGDGFDLARAVALDDAGDVHLTGGTTSSEATFPVRVGPTLVYHPPQRDAFVAKIRIADLGIEYCGYIGGEGQDDGEGIAVAADGSAIVVGATRSDPASFPVRLGPSTVFAGILDGYLARVLPDGSALAYCGYLGGSEEDRIDDVALDAAGRVHVVGSTRSDEQTFPVTTGPDLTHNGDFDAFVGQLRGAPPWSGFAYLGYVGGEHGDFGAGIALDRLGNVHVAGWTDSDEKTFPARFGPDILANGSTDGFVGVLAASPPSCAVGTVGLRSLGRPFDVLSANGTTGGVARVVTVRVATPIELAIGAAPRGPVPGPFVVYAWPLEPDRTTASPQPAGLGTTCLPTPLAGGMPLPAIVWSSLGRPGRLGASTFPTGSAPAVFARRPAGRPFPLAVTLQGLILDDASAARVRASVTNAVVLRIVP